MQTVDEVYNEIRAGGNYWYDTRVLIQNTLSDRYYAVYNSDKILSLSIKESLFGDGNPSVGNCTSSELNLEILGYRTDSEDYDVSIPRAADVHVHTRICNSERASEWIELGMFFIDTREITHNNDGMDILNIHAYDAMLKAEMDYPSTENEVYPMLDTLMVEKIAEAMGISPDPRNEGIMTFGYKFPIPIGYSCREVLSRIAASYGGNFVISQNGQLRLILISQIPPETRYLIDNSGNSITFGGDRILV